MKKTTEYILLFFFLIGVLSSNAQENYTVKYKKGKYAYVNEKGKKKTKYVYSYAEDFSEGFGVIEKNLKFGYLDDKFKVVIPYKYDDAGAFNDGLAYVKKEGKYGYINQKNETIIDFKFDYAANFKNGFAIVRIENIDTSKFGDNKYIFGIINKNDKLLSEAWYSRIGLEKDSSYSCYIRKDLYTVFKDGTVTFHEKDTLKNAEKKIEFAVIEQKPVFPRGDKALMEYLSNNVHYPSSAKEYDIQGKVYIGFVIDKKGNVVDVRLLNLVHPLLNKEAFRVVKSMPKWTPGVHKGKPVKVRYQIPINFKLS